MRWVAWAAMLAALLIPSHVAAKSHLWDTLRVYSNDVGNIQFIDMFVSDPAGTGEFFLQGHLLESDANVYSFPNDLPMGHSTFQTWVLIATQDYADLPGAPVPDFIMPPNFFDPTGDEIVYRTFLDVFTIPPGAMPTDGILMLDRNLNTPVNEGINFAGVKGSVDPAAEPLPFPAWGIGLAALLMTLGGISFFRRARLRPAA